MDKRRRPSAGGRNRTKTKSLPLVGESLDNTNTTNNNINNNKRTEVLYHPPP